MGRRTRPSEALNRRRRRNRRSVVNGSVRAGSLPGVHDALATCGPERSTQRVRDADQRIHVRLWRAVSAWSGSRDVADEAVAEAFAQALRRGPYIADVDAWVWRAAFRIAAGELKQRRARARSVANVPERTADPPGEERLELEEALALLSEQQRACVVLREQGGAVGSGSCCGAADDAGHGTGPGDARSGSGCARCWRLTMPDRYEDQLERLRNVEVPDQWDDISSCGRRAGESSG